jgi:hypothetical protein
MLASHSRETVQSVPSIELNGCFQSFFRGIAFFEQVPAYDFSTNPRYDDSTGDPRFTSFIKQRIDSLPLPPLVMSIGKKSKRAATSAIWSDSSFLLELSLKGAAQQQTHARDGTRTGLSFFLLLPTK